MDGNDNTTSRNGNGGAQQLIAQWITSLAISVICCAVLFVVFAGYIVDLHSAINLATVRLEVVQEKDRHLMSEIAMLKRYLPQPPSLAAAAPGPEQSIAPPEAPVPEPLPSAGVEISEPAPIVPDESGDMTPVMLPGSMLGGEAAPVKTEPKAADQAQPVKQPQR